MEARIDMAQPQRHVYIGDGVYGRIDDHGNVILTTEDGIRATNTIHLEPEVLRSLMAWLSSHGLR